jgi:hypothetical protein
MRSFSCVLSRDARPANLFSLFIKIKPQGLAQFTELRPGNNNFAWSAPLIQDNILPNNHNQPPFVSINARDRE